MNPISILIITALFSSQGLVYADTPAKISSGSGGGGSGGRASAKIQASCSLVYRPVSVPGAGSVSVSSDGNACAAITPGGVGVVGCYNAGTKEKSAGVTGYGASAQIVKQDEKSYAKASLSIPEVPVTPSCSIKVELPKPQPIAVYRNETIQGSPSVNAQTQKAINNKVQEEQKKIAATKNAAAISGNDSKKPLTSSQDKAQK